jgi:hypothetical protein
MEIAAAQEKHPRHGLWNSTLSQNSDAISKKEND